MNGMLCENCHRDHQNAGEALQCDREGWHINYNTGQPCNCEAGNPETAEGDR